MSLELHLPLCIVVKWNQIQTLWSRIPSASLVMKENLIPAVKYGGSVRFWDRFVAGGSHEFVKTDGIVNSAKNDWPYVELSPFNILRWWAKHTLISTDIFKETQNQCSAVTSSVSGFKPYWKPVVWIELKRTWWSGPGSINKCLQPGYLLLITGQATQDISGFNTTNCMLYIFLKGV